MTGPKGSFGAEKGPFQIKITFPESKRALGAKSPFIIKSEEESGVMAIPYAFLFLTRLIAQQIHIAF